MNESRSLIRNSARSSDRLWLACRISTRNISTWSKGGRPPRERSARGTALSRSGRKSSKSTRPGQATRRYRCQYAVVYDEAPQLRFDVPPEDSARRCEMCKPFPTFRPRGGHVHVALTYVNPARETGVCLPSAGAAVPSSSFRDLFLRR